MIKQNYYTIDLQIYNMKADTSYQSPDLTLNLAIKATDLPRALEIARCKAIALHDTGICKIVIKGINEGVLPSDGSDEGKVVALAKKQLMGQLVMDWLGK